MLYNFAIGEQLFFKKITNELFFKQNLHFAGLYCLHFTNKEMIYENY